MDVVAAAVYGACGGALVQAVTFCADIIALQQARRVALGRGRPLRPLASVVDAPVDGLVLLTRLALGAVAGLLFHSSVSAPIAAVAVGASAPALLRQLGALRAAPGLAPDGTGPALAASIHSADPPAAAQEAGE
jgi:hypothetical protein